MSASIYAFSFTATAVDAKATFSMDTYVLAVPWVVGKPSSLCRYWCKWAVEDSHLVHVITLFDRSFFCVLTVVTVQSTACSNRY